jgi:hypothetical protein
MTIKIARAAVFLALVAHFLASPAAQTPRSTIFVINTNEFWLNLHDFLYVLGQARGRPAASLREAMRDAPADADQGLATLTAAEQKVWADAVSAYASGLSKKHPVDDRPLAAMVEALASAGEAATMAGTRVDPDARALLERAAPIYRKAWWPAHQSGNQAYKASLQPLIDRHGRAILAFVTSKYQLPWPAAGYPVHLAAYSDWAGAYSTYGNLLVVSTNAHSGTHGLSGLETMFHEGMHQWDDAIDLALRQHAQALGKQVPAQLSHAMIFFTAGEAVRRLAPEHVPVAEALGLWRAGLSFRAPLEEIWKPYLDGRGTRDEALAALVARTAVSQAAAQRSAPSPLFTFETDEFWLNLHHFLYVLGRAEAKMPDATRAAVAGAPGEAEHALRNLTKDEQRIWADAVTTYATGLSLKTTLENPMLAITQTLARADDVPMLSGTGLDPGLVTTLERAAPIYRKAWWPAHRDANRAWQASILALVDRYGRTTIDFVTKAYALPWPASGYPLHVSGYTNFGGACSPGGANFLVVSSITDTNQGLHEFEIIVHEAMHQWDGQVFTALATQAKRLNVSVPRDLPHAMIFFTAGEAVRRLDSTYVPYADAFEVWRLQLSGASLPAQRLKPLLDEIWRPYLSGRGTRDESLAALVARADAASR